MSMTDQSQKLKIRPLWPPTASIVTNTPQVSNIIDTTGFRSLTLVLNVGDFGDTDATSTVVVQHGDVANLSDAVDVPDAELVGTEAAMAPTFANDNTCCKIGYIGTKRYVRVTLTPVSNTGPFFMSGISIQGNAVAADQVDQKVT